MAVRASISVCSMLKSQSRRPAVYFNSSRHLNVCVNVPQLPKAFLGSGAQRLSLWYRKLTWLRGYGRAYSASSEGGDEEGKEVEGDSDSEGEGSLGIQLLPATVQQAIAPVTVPDNLEEVPILAISRNPIFPRFVKMLEVSSGASLVLGGCGLSSSIPYL